MFYIQGLGDARLRMPGGGPGAPPGSQDRQHMYQGGYPSGPRDFDRGPRGPMPGQRMPGGMGAKGQAELAMQVSK